MAMANVLMTAELKVTHGLQKCSNAAEDHNVSCSVKNNNKHLLDETESNIRFVLPGQMMLGEANYTKT